MDTIQLTDPASQSAPAVLEAAFVAYDAGEAEKGRRLLEQAIALEPVLKHPSALMNPVRYFAGRLLLNDKRAPAEAVRFMETLFAHTPPLAAFARDELAQVWVDVAFRAYGLGQMAMVRQAIGQAARLKPAWLLNRGLLSIGFEALLGQGAAATMRAAKPGALARRVTRWRRKEMIDSYLRSHAVRKLHVGSGGYPLEGWLNTDLSSLNRGGIVYLDATERLPFDDNSLDFIFSEHFIEHLTYAEGRGFLVECWRVLKPGGICRVATPRLELLVDLYKDRDGQYEAYTRWSFDRWVNTDLYSRALVVNNFFYNWGHRCIYDSETLSGTLAQAGFSQVEACRVGESRFPELRGLERHAASTGPEFNLLETMIFEAQK